MERVKKCYVAPETEVTHVAIENSICGGSVEFDAKPGTNEGMSTDEQVINKDFASSNDFINNNEGWD